MEARDKTIKIEGKIAGANISRMDRARRKLATAVGKKKLSVDLCGVTFMDGKAKTLLVELYSKTRAAFIADTPLTKYFAQQARQNICIGNGADTEFNSETKVRKQS
jgi:hypothetical protein